MRIARLVVGPQWRHQGVGSQLLRAAEMFALEQGCSRVRLETLAGGTAERFYRERGFLMTAALPRWREERDFLVLERELSAKSGPPRL
jgi:GNAT superfamily N-acetyltransferase